MNRVKLKLMLIEKDGNTVSGAHDSDDAGREDHDGEMLRLRPMVVEASPDDSSIDAHVPDDSIASLALMPGAHEDSVASAEGGRTMVAQESRHQGCNAWHCLAICCCASCLLLIALAMSLQWLLPPQLPEVNVCNQMTNWDNLGTKLQNLAPAGDVDLLISVFNPNRVDAVVRHAMAQFNWEGAPVGQWQLAEGVEVVAKGGTILDYELSVHFSPSVFTAVQMYDQYQNKSLVLDLVLQITTDLTFLGTTVGRHKEFELQLPIDVFSPAVHSLCKCNL